MKIYILILIATLITSCSKAELRAAEFIHVTNTPEDVFEWASTYLEGIGIDLGDYELRSLSYEFTTGEWNVFFSGMDGRIGGHFSVIVSDQDPETITLVPGI